MDILSPIANLFGAALPPIQRLLNLVVLIIIFIWIDGQMGFTYHYFSQRKIDEISSYNNILKDSSIDKATRLSIMNERAIIVAKRRMSDYDYTSNRVLTGWQFILSCNWLFALTILILPKLMIIGNKYTPRGTLNIQIATVIFIFCVIAVFETFICYFVDGFLPNKFFMILINSLAQVFFISFVIWLSVRLSNKQKAQQSSIE